jgi:aldose 1-epimerase
LTLHSDDGDQGFPGALKATITYVWTNANRLITDFMAVVDQPTPVNLVLHGYWNLAGPNSDGNIGDHLLQLDAGAYLPVDPAKIPTGQICPVAGTLFDFRAPQKLADRLDALRHDSGGKDGYDHCWAIDGSGIRRAATLFHPGSGRELVIETDRPGIQVYTANHFDGMVSGRSGLRLAPHCAVALETQGFPNAPNQVGFPDTILRPGQVWRSRTIYSFGVR